jgi:hypothetical protein
MRIGILGSGLMGGKLGTIFARGGHEVDPRRGFRARGRWTAPNRAVHGAVLAPCGTDAIQEFKPELDAAGQVERARAEAKSDVTAIKG